MTEKQKAPDDALMGNKAFHTIAKINTTYLLGFDIHLVKLVDKEGGRKGEKEAVSILGEHQDFVPLDKESAEKLLNKLEASSAEPISYFIPEEAIPEGLRARWDEMERKNKNTIIEKTTFKGKTGYRIEGLFAENVFLPSLRELAAGQSWKQTVTESRSPGGDNTPPR